MASLVPCPSCGRHVRVHDASCPFCAAVQPEGRTAAPAHRPRAKRAIAFVAASMSVAACGSSTTTTATPDATTSAAASSEPAPTTDAPVVDAPATRYGLPPFLAEDELV